MTTLEQLTQILVQNYKLDPKELTPQRPLTELGIDSLGMVDLMFQIEDEFGVKLPPETEGLSTLDEAARCIETLRAAQTPTPPLPQQPA